VLSRYLRIISAVYPEAVISGSFHDWRTVSIYRANPGIHAGYDIALRSGAAVPSIWGGRVVRILPWAVGEWGISVATSGGAGETYVVTYGHLVPVVSVGDSIRPGQTVGLVFHDHVDIKLQDQAGIHIDFGQPGFAALPPLLAGFKPGAGMPRGFVAGEIWNPRDVAGLARERERVGEVEKAIRSYLALVQEKVRRMRSDVATMIELGPGDLLSREEWEERRASLKSQEGEMTRVYAALKDCRRYRNQLDRIAREMNPSATKGRPPASTAKPAPAASAKTSPPVVGGASPAPLPPAIRLPELPNVPYPSVPGVEGPVDPVAAVALNSLKEKALTALSLYDQGAISRLERDRAVDDYLQSRLRIILAGSEWAKIIWPGLWWRPGS